MMKDSSRPRALVVVPCGRRKVWDKHPDHGSALARDAYTSPVFLLNRAYAELFGDHWVILSAKYGFLEATDSVSGPYDVTFKDRATGSITINELRDQIAARRLADPDLVIGLGGKNYRTIVQAAFEGSNVVTTFPFAGLPIGRYMQAIKRATANGEAPHRGKQ
jgi:hypothetical protein